MGSMTKGPCGICGVSIDLHGLTPEVIQTNGFEGRRLPLCDACFGDLETWIDNRMYEKRNQL